MKRYAQAKKIQTDIPRYKQINRYNRYIGLKRLYRLSVWHQVQKDKDVAEIWNVPEPPWFMDTCCPQDECNLPFPQESAPR